MIDAVFFVFHVAVEHGGIRVQAYLVRGAGGIEPLIAVDFVIADDVADPRMKISAPPPGRESRPAFFSCRKVSSIESLPVGRNAISTMVRAFRWT